MTAITSAGENHRTMSWDRWAAWAECECSILGYDWPGTYDWAAAYKRGLSPETAAKEADDAAES
jgi:hypothetical protein